MAPVRSPARDGTPTWARPAPDKVMLGKKPSMIRASTSVRLNVNPYLGTAGKPSTRTKVVAGRPRGDAKIAFSVFVHGWVWLFDHGPLVNIWEAASSLAGTPKMANVARGGSWNQSAKVPLQENARGARGELGI